MPSTIRSWSGATVTNARAYMRAVTIWPTSCARCGRTIDVDQRWVIGHNIPRALASELIHEILVELKT